jgi:hypothetical protein
MWPPLQKVAAGILPAETASHPDPHSAEHSSAATEAETGIDPEPHSAM